MAEGCEHDWVRDDNTGIYYCDRCRVDKDGYEPMAEPTDRDRVDALIARALDRVAPHVPTGMLLLHWRMRAVLIDLAVEALTIAREEGRCAATQWRPIETAPKDGTKILLLDNDGKTMETGYWNPEGDSWADENSEPCEAGHGTIQVTGSWFSGGGWFQPNEVIAWLPLPAPPRGA